MTDVVKSREEREHEEAEASVAATLRVVSRHGKTDRDTEDKAAAIAVLAEVLVDEAEARHEAEQGADQWGRSARGLREQLTSGPGQWRGFSG